MLKLCLDRWKDECCLLKEDMIVLSWRAEVMNNMPCLKYTNTLIRWGSEWWVIKQRISTATPEESVSSTLGSDCLKLSGAAASLTCWSAICNSISVTIVRKQPKDVDALERDVAKTISPLCFPLEYSLELLNRSECIPQDSCTADLGDGKKKMLCYVWKLFRTN